MPDIRAILESMSQEDRALYSQFRTDMRKCYLNAHNQTVNLSSWQQDDDFFMDLIDIKLMMLFDRAGALNTTKDLGTKEASKIEETIIAQGDALKVLDKEHKNGNIDTW